MLDVSSERETTIADSSDRQPIVRNTVFLTVAQVVGVPVSIVTNAMTARYLGAAAFGYLYIATTFNAFAFLVVDWGQHGTLPALVAGDRRLAGRLVGASIAWRILSSAIVYIVLLAASRWL